MKHATVVLLVSCVFASAASIQDSRVKPTTKYSASEQDATVVAPKNYKVELENDLVRVVRVTYDPHEKTPMHEHQGNAAVIVVLQGGGRMRQVNADGTITLIIPKSAIGSPAPGDLLGAVNGRTFTGDTPETQNLERSTLLVDHTFVKGQRDNGHPAATYTIVGNVSCGP